MKSGMPDSKYKILGHGVGMPDMLNFCNKYNLTRDNSELFVEFKTNEWWICTEKISKGISTGLLRLD